MSEASEQATRIRREAEMGTLNYEAEAVESIARSWDHAAAGNDQCSALALADALVWATLAQRMDQ